MNAMNETSETNEATDEQFAFLREIDKLKSVIRKSPLIDRSRRENTAEHSWHLAMYALVLAEHADADVNVDRVITMLLIHDIVEIDAGDHPIHDNVDTAAQQRLEQAAAERIFGLLPPKQEMKLRQLWQEFEAGLSADARFAKALDRLQPLLHNVATDGGTWREAAVTHRQVEERYGPTICGGSRRLWDYVKRLVDAHFRKTGAAE